MRHTHLKYWILLIVLAVTGCARQVYVADIDTSYYRINKRHNSDKELDEMIQPYRAELETEMNEVIARNAEELVKARPNATLNNWFADALLQEARYVSKQKVDIAMQNYGGIRVPFLKKGDVTVGNIYELMPFDNKLVLLTMSGELLQKLLNRIAEKGGWPISHTLQFRINGDVATDIRVHDVPMKKSENYTIAIADYIANGGDNCFFLEQAERQDFDLLIRDMIIKHLKRKPKDEKTIHSDKTKRILN